MSNGNEKWTKYAIIEAVAGRTLWAMVMITLAVALNAFTTLDGVIRSMRCG